MISELKKLKLNIAEVCGNILKLKTENRGVFNSFKFKSASSIYKRIVIEEKDALHNNSIASMISSAKQVSVNNAPTNASMLKMNQSRKIVREQEVRRLIDNNSSFLAPPCEKINSGILFNNIKNSLDNHFYHEKKIQKTIENQIKKAALENTELADIFLSALQKYLVANKFNLSDEPDYFDLLDVNLIEKYHINNFCIQLFKDSAFSEYIEQNFKKIDFRSASMEKALLKCSK